VENRLGWVVTRATDELAKATRASSLSQESMAERTLAVAVKFDRNSAIIACAGLMEALT
jgi:hypothetical protein